MHALRALLWSLALLVPAAAAAAVAAPTVDDIGVATIADAGSRVLRGATWFKIVAGARLAEGDIVEIPERAQLQVELAAGTTVNLVGPGTLYFVPASARGAPRPAPTIAVSREWAKIAAKPPGARIHTPQADIVVAEGVLVIHAEAPAELFVESGSARLIELAPSGAEAGARDAKLGEHWSKPPSGPYAMVPRAPKAFVDAMPRHFFDPLPAMAAKFKARPELVVDHEVTFAEAEPWLAGRERAAFEKRFSSRLRDPAFRRAVEPTVFRYPSWDRMLHPEKFAPKPPPEKSAPKAPPAP